uniref:Xylulose kinase-1 n=1 Tax=Tanacetum cinerariifolium TaxID=118510 RepID=A0A699KN77_TANCI|nr:hypothetical protein [Tanacetum cinerariifolium]
MSNSHKKWLVQKQTALGKDRTNPLMADNLPRIVWYSTHHVTLMKSWLVQKQTALEQTTTVKEISNPFMAEAYCCMFVDDKVSAVKSKFSATTDVTRLQVLVDRKKVVVTKAAIRDVLRLDDAEGVDCLPNEEIFAELARMDSSSKFYMYPRFIQLIIRNQLDDLSTHTTKYTSPTLTQKVFANMKRVGKGFSGVETPLFEGMIVEGVIEEEGTAEEQVQDDADDVAIQGDVAQDPSIPSPTPPTPPP